MFCSRIENRTMESYETRYVMRDCKRRLVLKMLNTLGKLIIRENEWSDDVEGALRPCPTDRKLYSVYK